MSVDMDKVVRTHIRIRDKRAELRKAYEAEDNALKEKQEKLENFLLLHLNENHGNSMNTAAGTFYRQKDIIPTCHDWDAFYKWVAKNNAFDFLERRVKKTSVSRVLEEEGPDHLPPGISTHEKYVVRVRRN